MIVIIQLNNLLQFTDTLHVKVSAEVIPRLKILLFLSRVYKIRPTPLKYPNGATGKVLDPTGHNVTNEFMTQFLKLLKLS